ncbi:MAG TPA: DUF6339 family protein, partial [Acidobacteriota bacterium]|nr:DUF6339 family protein [Acidobacteriota bacterium]
HVNQNFVRSKEPEPPVVETTHIGHGDEARIAEVSSQLRIVISRHEDDRPKSDGRVAVMLHQALPLTRKEAAEMRFWQYMTIVQCPFYVAWRYFDEREQKVNRERYLGPLDGNALSRLWWWAELTADRANQNYDRTLKGAESGEFVKGTVENLLGGNRLIVNALIDLLFGNGRRPPEALVNKMFMKMNALLVTVAADALTKEEIEQLVRQVYDTESAHH